jgi:hypothetical protein
MSKLYYDTETCGFHGPIVLIQYAYDEDPDIDLWCPWTEPIYKTIELIEEFMDNTNVGFNLAFDHFHLCQMYTTLLIMSNSKEELGDCLEEYAEKEAQGRFGPCLKPHGAFDVMLHARKTEYQSTMDRNDIRVKRIPTPLAWQVASELDQRIPLKDVYFARRKDTSIRWQVKDIENDIGEINPDFKDILLKFAPSSALKALAYDALGIEKDDILLFADVEVNEAWRPDEVGYAPFYPHSNWPEVIRPHINHWAYNKLARKYASDDVRYTRALYKYFSAKAADLTDQEARKYSQGLLDHDVKDLQTDDDDSVLACMVGAVRWRGYAINIPDIQQLKDSAQQSLDNLKYNYNSVAVIKKYLKEVMSQTESLVLKDSTKAVILENIAKWRIAETCVCCGMEENCPKCRGEGLIELEEPHPAAIRAREILNARHAKKEIELYDKLLTAGRFHASFKVIGTLSSRMSGADGLNPQGIKRDNNVRRCFPLADNGLVLCGGDFAGFEVVLIDAVYGDPLLREDLKSGKKIHSLFGQYLFPTMTYDEICESKGADDPWQDYYTRSKNGVFALCYGGEAYTLSNRVGVSEEIADSAYKKFVKKYKKFGEERRRYFDMFCSMRQPNGLGTKVEWHEPSEYIESIFGFRRYFSLENRICEALYSIAEDPPKSWLDIKIQVVRRDRAQTACGAVRSALFAAAFAAQASNMRAAGNHVIQSSGAQINKALQRNIWDIQPEGINAWRVQPMNIHDEIMCPAHPDCLDQLKAVVDALIVEYSVKVPLIEIDWSNRINSWADK